MTQTGLTIAGRATPAGRGGIAVIRVSGPGVQQIAVAMLGRCPGPRHAELRDFLDAEGQPIDTGIALYFPAPDSYTGEDVLELQCHGGTVVTEILLERVLALGARIARPGEFSERAFLNDKLDLLQAEAIADLIDAGSRRAAQAALRSLQGEFSARVNAVCEALTALRVYVEAAIDFPEEEIDFLASTELAARLADVRAQLAAVLVAAEQGALLTRGLCIAIAGRPNAGKSSLLNALAGDDVAIVTAVAGTTRDLLRQRVVIDGVPVELIDTAGLREIEGHASHDAIEAEGMRRARAAIARADHLLFVVDAAEDPEAKSYVDEQAALPAGVAVTIVMNKMDLFAARAASAAPMQPPLQATTVATDAGIRAATPAILPISATTGEGLDALRAHLASLAGNANVDGGAFSARARHVEALRRATTHLDTAATQLAAKQGELAAFELREAQRALGEVVGDVTSDELLGRIFGSFCIGK